MYVRPHIHTYIVHVHVHAELATLEWPVDKLSQNPGENTGLGQMVLRSKSNDQLHTVLYCSTSLSFAHYVLTPFTAEGPTVPDARVQYYVLYKPINNPI